MFERGVGLVVYFGHVFFLVLLVLDEVVVVLTFVDYPVRDGEEDCGF